MEKIWYSLKFKYGALFKVNLNNSKLKEPDRITFKLHNKDSYTFLFSLQPLVNNQLSILFWKTTVFRITHWCGFLCKFLNFLFFVVIFVQVRSWQMTFVQTVQLLHLFLHPEKLSPYWLLTPNFGHRCWQLCKLTGILKWLSWEWRRITLQALNAHTLKFGNSALQPSPPRRVPGVVPYPLGPRVTDAL